MSATRRWWIIGLLIVLAACGGDDPAFDEPPDEVPDEIVSPEQRALAEARAGFITHDVPARMTEDQPVIVTVSLGNQITRDDFESALRDRGVPFDDDNTDQLDRVGDQMTVLVRGDDFAIEYLSSERQSLASGTADWPIRITPLEAGSHPLSISVEMLVDDIAVDSVLVYEGDIEIVVGERSWAERLGLWSSPALSALLILASLASGLAGIVAIRDHLRRPRPTDGVIDLRDLPHSTHPPSTAATPPGSTAPERAGPSTDERIRPPT